MKNQDNTISLRLTLEEVNSILSSLGGRPYIQVYELIQKIQQQADAQVQQQADPPSASAEPEDV